MKPEEIRRLRVKCRKIHFEIMSVPAWFSWVFLKTLQVFRAGTKPSKTQKVKSLSRVRLFATP